MSRRQPVLDVRSVEFAYGAELNLGQNQRQALAGSRATPQRWFGLPASRWREVARVTGALLAGIGTRAGALAGTRQGPALVSGPDAAANGLFHLGPLSFDVQPREFLSIIGPNGSGKSTLLGLLGGLLRPARGRVTFVGREVSLLVPRERARCVAYVRQETPLVFPIRVEQFVLLGRFPFAHGLGFDTARDREMAGWAMKVTSINRLASRRMDEISGGERQRAVLARALAQEPELLLLDEPTANLDLNFQVEMLRLIRSLAEEHGFAMVAVMHELNLAAEFSDSLLLLKSGRPFRYGGPAEVLTRQALEEAYGVAVSVDRNPYSGRPRVTLAATR